MRAKKFLPQITSPRKLNLDLFYQGCFLICWGLFEKIYIAGNLAKIVDPVFASPPPYNGSIVLIANYAFNFQLLCDFDGYANIARGLGLCMGFDIMFNFNLPYFAGSPQEFWKRWNISLSSWFRDYLFIPLTKGSKSKLMVYLKMFLTMLLVGLWHGAANKFIFWGAYHGFLLIIYDLIGKIKFKLKPSLPLKIFQIIVFIYIVNVPGQFCFRAESFTQAKDMFLAIFTNFHIENDFFTIVYKFLIIILPLLLIQILQYKTKDLMYIFKLHWALKTFIYAFLTYLTLKYGIFTQEAFIYFQF